MLAASWKQDWLRKDAREQVDVPNENKSSQPKNMGGAGEEAESNFFFFW